MVDRSLAVSAWESLYRAQVTVLRELLAQFPDHGLSFGEYDLLYNLVTNPNREARIRDVNKQLLLAQPSLSRMVDRLAARGVVAKRPDPVDARGTLVRVTDAGYDAFRRVGAVHAAAIAARMSTLSETELRQLAELTDKLRHGAD